MSNENDKKPVKKGFWGSIGCFFKNLHKAYYAGAAVVVSTVLLFSAWVYVPSIGAVSDFMKDTGISAILGANVSGYFSIPRTLAALNNGVDQASTAFEGLVDFFNVTEKDVTRFENTVKQIELIAPTLGINLSDLGIKAEDVTVNLGQTLFTEEQISTVRSTLSQVSTIVHSVSAFPLAIFAVCLAFNIYAFIVTFFKKKVTGGCIAAFAIEGAICLLTIIGIFAVNSYVQSQVFFLDSIIVPTGWAWVTLLVNIFGIFYCVYARKSLKLAKNK